MGPAVLICWRTVTATYVDALIVEDHPLVHVAWAANLEMPLHIWQPEV